MKVFCLTESHLPAFAVSVGNAEIVKRIVYRPR